MSDSIGPKLPPPERPKVDDEPHDQGPAMGTYMTKDGRWNRELNGTQRLHGQHNKAAATMIIAPEARQ